LAPDKLKIWSRRLTTDITSQGPVARVELLRDSGEPSQNDRIAVYTITEETDPDALAEDAWSQADDDAATRPNNSQQRYGLFGFRADLSEHDCMYSWLVRGRGPGAVGGPFGGDTMDPPNERGLVGAALRAMNEAVRQMAQMSESQAGSLAAELERERQLRRAAESAQLEQMVIQQTLLDAAAERGLKLENEARRAARIDKIVEGLAPMVPVLAGELLAGRGLTGTGKTGRDSAVGLFLSSLDEEQLKGIVSVLSQEQALSVIEIYKNYRRDANAHAAAVASAERELHAATSAAMAPPAPTPIRPLKGAT